MKVLYLGAMLALATAVAGCASAPPRPTLAAYAVYAEPDAADADVATVRGALMQRLLDASRVRLEGIDGVAVPAGPRVPVPIRIKAGARQLAILCEAEFKTGSAWITLGVELQPGHAYVLRCEQQSAVANVGTDFRVEDESDANRVVAKGSSWGPSSNPKGRAF